MVAVALSPVRPADFLALTKPRIVLLVLLSAACGAYMGAVGRLPGRLLLDLLLGTMLVAAGTNALNQVVEADADGRMRRTMRRPLPAGRLGRPAAAVFAGALGTVGVAYLALRVNAAAAALAAVTLVLYVFVYTPLKRTTPLAILVGAIPGALPVVGGWAAARGTAGPEAWALFAALALWQIPHVLALTWTYREDYARGGFRMLWSADGRATFALATVYAGALVPVALAPTALGLAGPTYFWIALLLSLGQVAVAAAAARRPSPVAARRLFRATVVYLPAVQLLMMVDRLS